MSYIKQLNSLTKPVLLSKHISSYGDLKGANQQIEELCHKIETMMVPERCQGH